MQSYKNNKIVDTKTGSVDELMEEIKKSDVDYYVIANLPKVGQIVEINGLKFRVRDVNQKGKVSLRIFRPE